MENENNSKSEANQNTPATNQAFSVPGQPTQNGSQSKSNGKKNILALVGGLLVVGLIFGALYMMNTNKKNAEQAAKEQAAKDQASKDQAAKDEAAKSAGKEELLPPNSDESDTDRSDADRSDTDRSDANGSTINGQDINGSNATGEDFIYSTAGVDPLNTSYTIDGKSVALQNGKATIQAPNSTEKITVMVWGQPTYGNLRGNSDKDASVILEQTGAGSGVFYYVAASLVVPEGYTGTNAELLGDRIAIQGTLINNQIINVNFADRKPGEPMTTQPSVGVSKYYKVEKGKLVETQP